MKNTRCIPNGYELLKENKLGAVYGQGLIGIAYEGKRSKGNWHYKFKSQEKMDEYVKDFFEGLQRHEDWKEERRMTRKLDALKAKEQVKIGTIFYNSWGWEQTNIDFFQVVEIKGSNMVLKEIAGTRRYVESDMAGRTKAIPNCFVERGEVVTKKLSLNPSFRHGGCSIDAGKEHYFSTYA